MLFLRHQPSSGLLLRFTWQKVCYLYTAESMSLCMVQVLPGPTFPMCLGRDIPAEPASLLPGSYLAEEHHASGHGL